MLSLFIDQKGNGVTDFLKCLNAEPAMWIDETMWLLRVLRRWAGPIKVHAKECWSVLRAVHPQVVPMAIKLSLDPHVLFESGATSEWLIADALVEIIGWLVCF